VSNPDDEVVTASYPLSAMTWNEQTGNATRAFTEWGWVDQDIRAYLKVGLQLAEPEYDRLRAEFESSSPDDGFEVDIAGLNYEYYQWMLFSSVVKDGVTAFEVYMERPRMKSLGSTA
jgi:hypothetical protein